jgi:hypothetical protein
MNIGVVRWHYEKSCSLEPHYATTRAPKQLLQLHKNKNKEIHWQLRNFLYCNCNFVANGTLIRFNVHIINMNIINHV